MTLNLDAFKKTLVYEQSGAARTLIADLRMIADSDAIAEKNQKKLGQIALGLGIGLFLFFFICILLPPLFLVFVLLGIALIIVGVLWNRENKFNIANERYELPKKLIPKMLRDMNPEAPIGLSLNFRPSNHKQKKVDTIPDPNRSKWKIDRFIDPWLQLEGQFLDQTHFQLSVTEFTHEKYGWKRSRSGKSKFKRKTKPKGLEIELQLQFSRNKYGAISVLRESFAEAIKLPDHARIKRLRVGENKLLLAVKIPPLSHDPKAAVEAADRIITQMLLSLYHGMNLAKKISQPTSA